VKKSDVIGTRYPTSPVKIARHSRDPMLIEKNSGPGVDHDLNLYVVVMICWACILNDFFL